MIFPYRQAEYEEVPCNLCGRNETEILAERDRNGLAVRSVICRWCGLIYINPRMTKEWYGRYYGEEYRAQMARFRGRQETAEDFERMFADSMRKGSVLVEHLKSFLASGLTVEVGSGVGGTLAAFSAGLTSEVIGIEPSPPEAAYANARGIKTHQSLIEDFTLTLPPAANILSLRNLNHLLNPRSFFAWAWRGLEPNGRLILLVQDFRLLVKKLGRIERAVQIDHTYLFVPEVLEAFVSAAGFDILQLETSAKKPFRMLLRPENALLAGQRILLVAKKSPREPFPPGGEIIRNYPAVAASLSRFNILRYHIPYRIHQFLNR